MSSAAVQKLSSSQSVPENNSRYNFVRYSRWTTPIHPRPPCSTSSLHYTSHPFTKLRETAQKRHTTTTKTTTTRTCSGEKQQAAECYHSDSTNREKLINHWTINSTYRARYTNPQERNNFDNLLKTTRFGHSPNGYPVIGIIPNIMFRRQRSLT